MTRVRLLATAVVLAVLAAGCTPTAARSSAPSTRPRDSGSLADLPKESSFAASLSAQGVKFESDGASAQVDLFGDPLPARHMQTSLGGLDVIFLDRVRDLRACENTAGGFFSYVLTSDGHQQTIQSPRRLYFALTPSVLVISDQPGLHAAVHLAVGGSPLLC